MKIPVSFTENFKKESRVHVNVKSSRKSPRCLERARYARAYARVRALERMRARTSAAALLSELIFRVPED